MHLSRRRFALALAATPALASPQQPAPPANPEPRRGTLPEVPPFQAPLEFARKDVPPKVRPFPMTQVRLLAGPFKEAAESNRAYMSRLPVDRLVRNFRVNSGLPTDAKPFGGWEQPNNAQTLHRDSELRGHFTGHFLSASAQLYASTGDQAAKAKGDQMVDELARCQAKLRGGYPSASPAEFFDRMVWSYRHIDHHLRQFGV